MRVAVPMQIPFPFYQLLKLRARFPALAHIQDRNPFLDGDLYLLHCAVSRVALGS